jgi:hypothetical protein
MKDKNKFNLYDEKFNLIDKRLDAQDNQLNRIEKYLNNHLEHMKINMDRWIKIYIPLIATLTPIILAALPHLLKK